MGTGDARSHRRHRGVTEPWPPETGFFSQVCFRPGALPRSALLAPDLWLLSPHPSSHHSATQGRSSQPSAVTQFPPSSLFGPSRLFMEPQRTVP